VLLLGQQQRAIGYVAICLGFSLELGGNERDRYYLMTRRLE
jgi:hypothetical protein